MKRRARIALATMLLVCAAAPERSAAQSTQTPQRATPRPVAVEERRMPEFRLRQTSGAALTERDLHGRWAVVFFGYTSCPDVCPTALSVLSDTFGKLGPDADRLRGLFVTIDPRRDRPQVLSAYLENFDRRILGGTGTPAEVEAVARAFGIRFEIHGAPAAMNYTVDHPAVMLVFEPGGRFVSLVPNGATSGELATLIARRMKANPS